MKGKVEGDELLNIPCAGFNFFWNGQSHKSAFFLMFGRDTYISTIANLQHPKLRYFRDKYSLLYKEMLRQAYMLAVKNSKRTRYRQLCKKTKELTKF